MGSSSSARPSETRPLVAARSRISRSRVIAASACSSSSVSRCSRSRSDRSSSSSCFGCVPKSTCAAISNASEPDAAVGLLDLGIGHGGELAEQRERLVGGFRVGRRVVLVLERLHLGGGERAAFGPRRDPESVPALDEDVHAPVVEHVHDLPHLGQRADVAAAGVVLQQEAEGLCVGDALADELLVPGLEDVERHALGRREHERQREEADLRHGGRVVGGRRSGARVSPCRAPPAPFALQFARSCRTSRASRSRSSSASSASSASSSSRRTRARPGRSPPRSRRSSAAPGS